MAKFEAEISANVDGFISNLTKAEKKVSEFSKIAEKDVVEVAKSFEPLFVNVNRLNANIASLKPIRLDTNSLSLASGYTKKFGDSLGTVSPKIEKFSRTTGQSNAVAMEFNRIIQDAPFGMIGIGNNIQQLAANFGNLKNQTGSTGAALKQTFASILSGGNLLSLGIAAITSSWTFYIMSSQKANKANEEVEDSMQSLISSLNEQSRVMYEGSKAASAESTQLRILYGITQDATQSTNERKDAANRLIKQYPELFKQFGTEGVMLGKAKSSYDSLSQSILATARAQAAYGKIGEKASQQIAIDETNKALREQVLILGKQAKEQEQVNKATQGSNSYGAGNILSAQDTYKISSQIADANKQINNNLLERAKLQEGIIDLEKIAISNQVAIADGFGITSEKAKGASKSIELANNTLYEFILKGRNQEELITQLEIINVKYKEIYESIRGMKDVNPFQNSLIGGLKFEEQIKALNESMKTQGASATGVISIPLNLNTEALNTDKVRSDLLTAGVEAANSFNYGFSDILDNGIINSISGLASGIGDALGSGGNVLQSAGKALLGSLGSILTQLGEMAIGVGVGIGAIKTALKTLNPVVAIAAGVALVALGSAVSASTKSLGNSSGGGSYAQSSVSSSNVSTPMQTGSLYNNSRQVVELKLRNTELVGAVNLNNNRNNRLS